LGSHRPRTLPLAGAAILALSLTIKMAAFAEDAAETVRFAAGPGQPDPLILHGYLRRPGGDGPFPAAILLHGCGGDPTGLDRNWGERLQSWGYVSLTVDSSVPEG
jgi:dienelactone hydrolase